MNILSIIARISIIWFLLYIVMIVLSTEGLIIGTVISIGIGLVCKIFTYFIDVTQPIVTVIGLLLFIFLAMKLIVELAW